MDNAKTGPTGAGTMETGPGIMNRTGIGTSAEMALDLIREAGITAADPLDGAQSLAEYRRPYVEQKDSIGSRPQQPQATAGGNTLLLLDKLGERLAFERQGVRLYECLIGKAKLLGPLPGGPTVGDLEHILEEEKEHFRFLQKTIVQAGGDPTVQTPCADIAGILSQGVLQVVADPRTTIPQCLEAILVAELVDNDAWTMLKPLAKSSGYPDLPEGIEKADENEKEHLSMVRGWLSSLMAKEAAAGETSEEAAEGRPSVLAQAASGVKHAMAKGKSKGRK